MDQPNETFDQIKLDDLERAERERPLREAPSEPIYVAGGLSPLMLGFARILADASKIVMT
jgi:hypothetical protein